MYVLCRAAGHRGRPAMQLELAQTRVYRERLLLPGGGGRVRAQAGRRRGAPGCRGRISRGATQLQDFGHMASRTSRGPDRGERLRRRSGQVLHRCRGRGPPLAPGARCAAFTPRRGRGFAARVSTPFHLWAMPPAQFALEDGALVRARARAPVRATAAPPWAGGPSLSLSLRNGPLAGGRGRGRAKSLVRHARGELGVALRVWLVLRHLQPPLVQLRPLVFRLDIG
mmetsp:Transcript_121899/g.339815  ORF Transcript_121899/g.339815 Transcript_121899/m.339815 type:complete len:226 (+) Transcript_121899:155-832(+)